MSKTQWQNGSFLTPAFMQAFAGTNAVQGHAHDGADADGSCPRIVLTGAAQVQGILPKANLADYTSGNVVVRVETPYSDTQQDFTCSFEKFGDIVTFNINAIYVHSTANDELRLTPASGNWPADILPSSGKFVGGLYASKETDEAKGPFRHGALSVSSDSTGAWFCYIDSTSYLVDDDWGFNATSPKGFASQSFNYSTA